MNPVNAIIERLNNRSIKNGVVQSINTAEMKIAVGGIVETWPLQVGLNVGDNVIIYEGRVIKSVGMAAAVYEV